MDLVPTEEGKTSDVATLLARIAFLTSEFSCLSTKYANIKKELDRLSCRSSDSAFGFSGNLLRFIASLFDNQQYSDVEFKTSTSSLKAHRFVLEAREACWSEAGESTDSRFIDISYVREDVARTFVKWLYTGDCEPPTEASDDFLLQLLSLATSFHLPLLIDRVETLIIPLISKENFVQIFAGAHKNNAKNLVDRCLIFAKDIYPAFSASDLAPLSPECLLLLIRKYSSPFHEAARLNRIDVLHLLFTSWNVISPLSVTESVNEFDDKGETPLSLALSLGHFDVASALLKAGASLGAVLHSGQHSLLQCALLSSNTDAAIYLLEHKCQVEAVDPDTQDSPLHMMCRGLCSSAPPDHQRMLIEALLLAGANTQILNPDGQSSLHLSILHLNEVAFQVLMANTEHCDLNLLNRQGIPPLWLALVAQFVPKPLSDLTARRLSELGFAVDFQKSLGQRTVEFATQLIAAGANVNVEMTTTVTGIPPLYCLPAPGDTALLAAARHGLEDAILFLLNVPDIRTDVCSRSTLGESALHLAVESGLTEAACRLARLGASPNTVRLSASPSQPRRSSALVGQPAVDGLSVTKTQMASSACDRSPTLPIRRATNPFGDSSDSEESQELEGEEKQGSNGLSVVLDRRERGNADGNSKESLTGSVHTPGEGEKTSRRETPLHLAVHLSMYELLRLYIKEGGTKGVKCPDWFIVNESGDTVFGLVLTNYDSDLAEDLLTAALAQLARVKVDHSGTLTPRDVFDKMTFEMVKIRPLAYGLLQRTIESGSREGVDFLLKYSIDVNPSAPLLTTQFRSPINSSLTAESFVQDVVHIPLWMALSAHRNDMASLLVEHGADVDSWSELSSTGVSLSLLHRAILCGLEEVAAFLIDSGCDCLSPPRLSEPTTIPASGQYRLLANRPTPLHLATSVGLPGLLSILLAVPGVDVNAKDDLGRTPLHLSVEENRLQAMEVLLNDSRINLRSRDNRGFTAFRVAIDHHHLTAARSLQQKDPSLFLECDNTGRNVLHSSVQTGDCKAVFFLIQIGIDMNAPVRDSEALSPLHIGITAGILEDVLRSMILAGASVSAVTKQKQTGLHLAVLHDQPTLLRCLLENGAPPNAQDADGNTALHLAMKLSNLLCAEFLLSVPETDATLANSCGQQPLHLLAHQPRTEEGIRDCFFDRRPDIDVNALDAAGNTPLMLAFAEKNIDFCVYLLSKGASLGNVNFDNWSIFTGGVTSPDFRQLKQILGCLLQEPAWSDGPFCVECFAPFGFKRRKHHCRHCGRVLCNACSEQDVPIVKYGLNKPVRVCKTCFYFINNPSVSF
nr:unnamed protein product [Spirometra erinaceieuropaei]